MIQDAGHRLKDTSEYRIHDAGIRILDTITDGYRMKDKGYRIQDTG